MKRLVLVAALAVLTGCASASTPFKEYVSQGFNLTECGPAVGASARWWATGERTTRFQARAFDREGVNWARWWSLETVQRYLSVNGVRSGFRRKAMPQAFGVYSTGSHFVAAKRAGDNKVAVSDPLQGVKVMSGEEFKALVTGSYLEVYQ